PEASLDRLVRVRHRTDVDRLAAVAGTGELRGEQLRGVGLGEEARFEVQPRRQAEVPVVGPGVAVDAAVLAAAVGIDGEIERNVRRAVARDDAAGVFDQHARVRSRGGIRIRIRPAVVHGEAVHRFEPAGQVRYRPTTLDGGAFAHTGILYSIGTVASDRPRLP